jgi:selenocysteine lyase/cysteine desulfurase
MESWRPYKVRPAPNEPLGKRFETGTLAYELLAGFVAAVEYIDSIGWEDIVGWERSLGERFLAGLPPAIRLHGLRAMDGRVPTFAFSVDGIPAAEAAARLGERGFAVWHGNYYALEVMKRLGLEDDGGAVRVGFVHYNTADEVDRLLDELARLE